MAARNRRDELKAKLAEIVIESSLPFLPGWLATLGELGRPPKKGDPPVGSRDRVSAAKTGVDFVTKFLGEVGESDVGRDLLRELNKIEQQAAISPTGGNRPEDSQLGGKEADMEPRPKSDRRDN